MPRYVPWYLLSCHSWTDQAVVTHCARDTAFVSLSRPSHRSGQSAQLRSSCQRVLHISRGLLSWKLTRHTRGPGGLTLPACKTRTKLLTRQKQWITIPFLFSIFDASDIYRPSAVDHLCERFPPYSTTRTGTPLPPATYGRSTHAKGPGVSLMSRQLTTRRDTRQHRAIRPGRLAPSSKYDPWGPNAAAFEQPPLVLCTKRSLRERRNVSQAQMTEHTDVDAGSQQGLMLGLRIRHDTQMALQYCL